MSWIPLWKLLHLFFAFSFVGTLVLADWNGRAARATSDWRQRALLFDIMYLASRGVGLGSLLLLGVLGNLLAVQVGYRMSTDAWLRWVNGLWVCSVLVLVLIGLPAAKRVVGAAQAGMAGGATDDYEPALKRWRLGNVGLSLLYLAQLVMMVFGVRS